MSLLNPTTILVALLLLYISTFILFAFVRVATGVSIQRLGYFSLRRISYAPQDGVQIDIRGLGLSLHRPSFSQPTWIRLRLTDLKVTIDPKQLKNRHEASKESYSSASSTATSHNGSPEIPQDAAFGSARSSSKRSQTWRRLTRWKEKLKRMHSYIHWLAIIDLHATNTSVYFVDAGYIQVGSLTLAVDTRRKMVEQGRLFRHKKEHSQKPRPAEWIMTVRNIILAVDGRDPMEIMDNLQLNIHGHLYDDLEGLRDTSVAVKIGRLHFPYDDLMTISKRIQENRKTYPKLDVSSETDDEISFADFVEELDKPGSREEAIVQTVADSREFVSSILRGIEEIQVALSFFRISRSFKPVSAEHKEMQLNLVTHEIGIDLHRMDENSPAHRMYFQKRDIAHQALLAAISISVSMEDSSGATDRLLYIPMATTTIKTTLPSKTVCLNNERDTAERNSNVFFANCVITSPSLDMEPRHVSQVLRLAEARTSSSPRGKKRDNHRLISRLLPKARINFSIHEPVVRFVLPIPKDAPVDGGDYNLLISSISSVSLDIESFHSSEDGFHYSLSSTYRVASHQLYYQTPAGIKHNLLQTQDMEVRVHLNATPEICVFVTGSLNSFSVHMVNPNVNRGIKQVVEQVQAQLRPRNRMQSSTVQPKSSFLRRLPPWLMRVQFEANELTFEVAGPPPGSSKTNRGVALHLDSWTADYRAQKLEPAKSSARRRTSSHSHSSLGDDSPFRFTPTSPPRRSGNGQADGRRLAVHIRGLEGFVIESEDYMEPESFLSLPRCEVALSTHSDLQGPIFHVNSTVKALFLEFSLYRIYSLGVALNVLSETFMRSPATKVPQEFQSKTSSSPLSAPPLPPSKRSELTTVDLRMGLVRVKGIMPNDPRLMLHVYGVAAGSHRWSAPFFRCQLVRLYAAAPKFGNVWERFLGMHTVRVDLRESKRRHGQELREERSIDVSAELIRIGVPHHMIMHRIFDNFTVTVKALKTLYQRYKTNSDIDVLEKEPEGPKKVPRISVRTRTLAFQLEDDAFEWKLGCIYRAGLVEQRHRLAREEAFMLKTQKIKEAENRRASSRFRTHSAHPDPHRGRASDDRRRSASIGPRESTRSFDDKPDKYGRARYDTDGAANISSSSKVPEKEAWIRLQEYNSRNWKSKIDAAVRFQTEAISKFRNLFAGAEQPPDDVEDDEPILAIPNRPGLMAALISDVHLVIDKPSFPVDEYAQFLHRIGKGMPLDMKYSLLIPMSIHLDMGEARVTLRDYPLDLLHIPALRPGQSSRLPSWSLQTNFVIAEEFRNRESTRDVPVCVVPPTTLADGQVTKGLFITVRRTIAPVKTYSEPIVDINTSLPTSITWCMSYQPVIQDMMKVIEGFTKVELDPSERVGFWDKIRLSFHSRIKVRWKGDGDVHLRLKGSRDPYVITGFGAGFVMCWRKDVQWNIHPTDDPKEFMTVTSGEYVLAVPDYSQEARYSYAYAFALDGSKPQPPSGQAKNAAHFKKVMMKLSGSVKWVAGLVFERNLDSGRSFDFKSHFDVVLRNPHYIDESQRKDYDAYRGFRSNHIHLSVAVMAPNNAEQTISNYNTVHLTPRLFTHFFHWWSLFSGVMSLPVRQGPLWPGITKTSKKFGRHLATVKYKLLLSPLFASHIYKHKDPEDYGEDVVTATGVKVRLGIFKFDLHQRRERINTPVKGRLKQIKSSAMRINRAELDFEAADFRAVSATIEGTTLDEVLEDHTDIVESFQQPVASVDVSRFSIPDQDYTWIDMDDFVELDWILPQESNPKTKILPLAYTPRFTYFRQTDHGHAPTSDNGSSQFGDEPTHECVMSQGNGPWQVQMDLMKERLATLENQTASHELQLSEHELRLRNAGGEDHDMKVKHELLLRQAESLARRHKFLNAGLRQLEKLVSGDESPHDGRSEASSGTGEDMESNSDNDNQKTDGDYEPPDIDSADDFNNRFTIHNPQVKWNNALRDIMVRYGHQVSQRRGFVYYMSQQAVKFISDIVEEQSKNNRRRKGFFNQSPNRDGEKEQDDDHSVQDRIDQLLHDAKRFVSADDPASASAGERLRPRSTDFSENISAEFTTQHSYHLRLIAPQIQLQSDKNPRSVTLVTAKGMTLKVLSIMDKRRVTDDVSGLVQRRFSLNMDGAQFFVATQKNLKAHLQFYAGNKYGNAPGSAWPPWLTLEAMFDFELLPFGFSRIIQRTSASLRYDKFNNLRLKYNDEVVESGGDHSHPHDADDGRVDQVWVDFPDVRAICDSTEYYSMYIIVLDLLLYNEPLEKVRSEKLEKIMFASDFSDLRGAPETVFKLQERIRQLEEIKEFFQVQAHYLDAKGWQDRITLERDLANCEEELFFIMKAITTSQRRTDERNLSKSSASMRYCLSASDIVWHLMRDRNEPLVEFQLRNASYERTDNMDGSNHNVMEIQRLYALNLLENAIYPQMIVPYMDHKSRAETSGDMMFRVQWYMLEAVAGIPVLDQFEVQLFPLKVQLERELGKKLFEYIFPGAGSNAFENGGFSPFMVKHIKPMDEDEEEDDENQVATPDFVSTPRSQGSTSTGEDPQALPGAGSIELRLQPTMTLPDNKHKTTQSSRTSRLKVPPLTRMHRDSNRSDRPGLSLRSSTNSAVNKKKSTESLRALTRTSTDRSIGGASVGSGSTAESKKFSLGKGPKKEQADDLTQMMSRASNYMILAHVKINDVVLCLSYKGRGDRNIEDVHDFVFRLPVLEYRNKTWSNLELALRLKKDVIKALISHAPAILGNKFSHPRPSKQQQQRLRELASSSQALPASDTALNSIHRPASAGHSLSSRDSTSINRFNSNNASAFSSSTHLQLPSSSVPQSVSSGTYPLARSVSYSSSNVSSLREPSIIINDSNDNDSSTSRQDVRDERLKTSQSFGGNSQDESGKRTIRSIGRKLLHRHTLNND